MFTLKISASCSTLICFLCFHYESVTLSRPGSWFNEGGVTSEKKQQACGFDSNVFVVNTVVNIGPVQIVPTQRIAVMARKIKHKHFQKESTFLLSRASGPREHGLPLETIQPLATRTEAWQAISGVLDGVMALQRRGSHLCSEQRRTCTVLQDDDFAGKRHHRNDPSSPE